MNPTLIAIVVGLITTAGSGLGAFFYRAHLDAGDVQAALDARAVVEQHAISDAYAKGQADSSELAQAQEQRAKQFEQDLSKEKSDHALDIRMAHNDLKAATDKCRVPRADVRVLDTPAVSGPPASLAGPGPGQQRDDAGSVAVVTVIETCERNRARFDANLGRLEQCVAAYNDLRSKLKGEK